MRLFNLDVRYKPSKEHIVPDTLSRLASTNTGDLPDNHLELDCLTYIVSTIIIKDDLRRRLKDGYEKDPVWKPIIAILDKNNKLNKNKASLPFVYGKYLPAQDTDPYFGPRPGEDSLLEQDSTEQNNTTDVYKDLIYYIDRSTGYYRVCVPRTVIKDIFDIVYSKDRHPSYERCFYTISSLWYVRRLRHFLREYLRYCPECLLY